MIKSAVPGTSCNKLLFLTKTVFQWRPKEVTFIFLRLAISPQHVLNKMAAAIVTLWYTQSSVILQMIDPISPPF